METTTTEAASVAKTLQEEAHGIEDQRKTTETVARSTLATVYTCTVAGNRFPAKFGCQPIKLELYLQPTRIPRVTSACTSGISGYIKGVE